MGSFGVDLTSVKYPPFYGVSLWEAHFVVSQKWSFPTTLLGMVGGEAPLAAIGPNLDPWMFPKHRKEHSPGQEQKKELRRHFLGVCSHKLQNSRPSFKVQDRLEGDTDIGFWKV